MREVVLVSPFRCRLWDLHGRLEEYLTESSCKLEIQSMQEHGQVVPAIGRPISGDSAHDIEIVCGARRLFVARHLNIPFAVDLRALSDRESIVLIDIENRLRKDWSAYERGRSFTRWLATGQFDSQKTFARALNISPSQVSRLLKLAQLPSIVIQAFANPADIAEMWGVNIYDACANPDTRSRLISRARALTLRPSRPPPRDIYDHLMFAEKSMIVRHRYKHELVMGSGGRTLFRIKHHDASVALLIEKKRVSASSLARIKNAVSEILQDAEFLVELCATREGTGRHFNTLDEASGSTKGIPASDRPIGFD